MRSLRAVAILALLDLVLLAAPAFGFGTKRTHEELARSAVVRADVSGRFSGYLRDELRMPRGVRERLAIQFGLDSPIDQDLIVDDDPETLEIETRLNRSLSRRDEDENGNDAEFPYAPLDLKVFFKPNRRDDADFDSCFRNLTRADVRTLIRIGTYAEDNPNPRSRHHFHDPERSHGSVGHGLDNSSALSDSLVGALLVEGYTAYDRSGSWLRAIAGVLLSPVRPLFGDLGNFDLRGRSAVDRALNLTLGGSPASDASPGNRFALPDAERYLYKAITAAFEDERENYLALHFLAVGHVVHLLQDMGSVAHVRNDFRAEGAT